jgi:hypothetical protein
LYIALIIKYEVKFNYTMNTFIKSIFTTLFTLCVSIGLTQTYYSKPTGFLNDLNTWGDQPNGTGAAPADFITPGQQFIIQNGTNYTIDNTWVIGGGNKAILGDGTNAITFTVPSTQVFEGIIDVRENALLELRNSIIPAMDSLYDNSTVNYAQDAIEILFNSYFNLEIEDINPTFDPDIDGTVSVRGDLNLIGNVTMPVFRNLPFPVTIQFDGDGNQLIEGNGAVVRGFDTRIIKSSGTIDLSSGTILSADNQLELDLSGTAVFNDNGNDLYAGKDLIISGIQAGYNLTAAIILAEEEPGIVLGEGDGNDFQIKNNNNQSIDVALNDLTLRAANIGGTYNFFDGGDNIVPIDGDLLIESGVQASIDFNNNDLQIFSDFIIETGFSGVIPLFETLSFNGNVAQTYNSDYPDLSVANLSVDKPNGNVVLNNDINISTDLALLSGEVLSSANAALYLGENAAVSAASNSSYVVGPVYAEVNSANPTTLTYPLGNAGNYRPVDLIIDQDAIASEWYWVELIPNAAAAQPLGLGLGDVSSIRHYNSGQVGSTAVEDIAFAITYGADDNITDVSIPRVAFDDNGEWINLGGVGTAIPNGSVTSTIPHTELGLFALGYVDPNPFIFYQPTTLNFFTQTFGSPSPEQIVSLSGSNLDGDITVTAPGNYEVSLTTGTGFSNSVVLTENNGEVAPTSVYVRLNRNNLGTESGLLEFTSPNAQAQGINLSGENIDPNQPGTELLYYWHFNDLSTTGTGVTEIVNDFSYLSDFDATMVYTGSGLADLNENADGSTINTALSEAAGQACNINNRSDNRPLLFSFNTSDVVDVVFEYAIKRSADGMLNHNIEYSVDGGQTFTDNDLLQVVYPITEDYDLVRINFTQIAAVNNNTDFQIRITFTGNAVQLNGLNQIDNITLRGDGGGLSVENNEMKTLSLFPNPVQNVLNISSDQLLNSVEVLDMTGKVVLTKTVNNLNTTYVNTGLLLPSVYIIKAYSDKGVESLRFIKQ